MRYEISFKPAAVKDIERLTPAVSRRVLQKIERLENDLAGDVKRLTNFTPEYRLRVGDWRVLFEALPPPPSNPPLPDAVGQVIIYRVLHRSSAYD